VELPDLDLGLPAAVAEPPLAPPALPWTLPTRAQVIAFMEESDA
jgi:hypothetical protein